MNPELTYAEINAIGQRLKEQLLDGDAAILVNMSAIATEMDTGEPSVIVTIKGSVDGKDAEFTGWAIDLANAIGIARGKLRNARVKAAEAKREKKAA